VYTRPTFFLVIFPPLFKNKGATNETREIINILILRWFQECSLVGKNSKAQYAYTTIITYHNCVGKCLNIALYNNILHGLLLSVTYWKSQNLFIFRTIKYIIKNASEYQRRYIICEVRRVRRRLKAIDHTIYDLQMHLIRKLVRNFEVKLWCLYRL